MRTHISKSFILLLPHDIRSGLILKLFRGHKYFMYIFFFNLIESTKEKLSNRRYSFLAYFEREAYKNCKIHSK